MWPGLQLQHKLYGVFNMVAVAMGTAFWIYMVLNAERSIIKFRCRNPDVCENFLFSPRIRKVFLVNTKLKWIWVVMMMLAHLLMILFEITSIVTGKKLIQTVKPATNQCLLVPIIMIFKTYFIALRV